MIIRFRIAALHPGDGILGQLRLDDHDDLSFGCRAIGSVFKQLKSSGNMLHVFAPAVVASHLNFLNIRIENFRVEDANVFDAEAQLRHMINLTLHPDLFRNGYGGGYGYPPDDVFTIPNITIYARNLTIREILDRITQANGNSLWVVKLKSSEFARRRPYWKGKPLDEYGYSPISSRWNFMPLSEIEDLANEQVVVELTFDDLAPERRIIPVITRYGLSGDAGGATGIFTEGHSYYGYGLSVQKVNQEGVTLKINLTVKLPNELEKKFEETFTVTHEGVIELHPTQGVAIKAYFDPRN